MPSHAIALPRIRRRRRPSKRLVYLVLAVCCCLGFVLKDLVWLLQGRSSWEWIAVGLWTFNYWTYRRELRQMQDNPDRVLPSPKRWQWGWLAIAYTVLISELFGWAI